MVVDGSFVVRGNVDGNSVVVFDNDGGDFLMLVFMHGCFEDFISFKHLTSHCLVHRSEIRTDFTHTCRPADGFDEGCMVDCGFS